MGVGGHRETRVYRRYSAVSRCIGGPLFIHHDACVYIRAFGIVVAPLSLDLFLLDPLRPCPSHLSFSLSHLHRALPTCLGAMTRAIEYSTFVLSSLLFSSHFRTVRPLETTISLPTYLPTYLPTSQLLLPAYKRERKRSYLRMSGNYGHIHTHYGVFLLLASTLSLDARPRSESRAVIMEIETPFE